MVQLVLYKQPINWELTPTHKLLPKVFVYSYTHKKPHGEQDISGTTLLNLSIYDNDLVLLF